MPQPTSPSRDYWISGYGLSRHIVLRQLQYFLGPSATVRPYSYRGREGFLINGPELTKEQIEDLKRQSEQYEKQQTMRMSNKVSSGTDDEDCHINEIVTINASRRHNLAHASASHYKRSR
ncbi:uncharacterized protein Z520_01631 [Fonsecaea multimorphosa CBS 102226]|uniref:Uncharacterized protein n=1 Tax=Fonsecaea multimorphosa CBS 102226 TaxID=1442371 RepID=A0A0D2L269_9EURO|nr:uncharacterized protein Z520_01631 [Fonsecaea multimorphosa CBS 102226]KIY03164.1 hypothetical protein Z520_01631 [Fonsecaea multimorphosa CBS 102226]OAL30407.1 hypothetical protein AYO22_01605 [Fonsecaea multimorphosa]